MLFFNNDLYEVNIINIFSLVCQFLTCSQNYKKECKTGIPVPKMITWCLEESTPP